MHLLLAIIASILLVKLTLAGLQNDKLENFDNPDKLPDRYIITMKNKSEVSTDLDVLAAKMGANAGVELGLKIQKYGQSMMSCRMPDTSVLEEVLNDDTVKVVEAEVAYNTTCITQEDAPYHLARTSSRDKGATSFSYSGNGSDVTIYIVDTGVRLSHVEFEGRASFGSSVESRTPQADLDGHGTHVAGIAAGRRSGIAKGAKIVSIRIFDDNGRSSTTAVLTGLRDILDFHLIRAQEANPSITDVNQHRVANAPPGYKRPKSVINMSIGGRGQSPAVDNALKVLNEFGLFSVAAAGNSASNACDFSPAFSTYPMTVGCTTEEDVLCSFSNHGACVNILAPGFQILSAGAGNDRAGVRLSGTSMSSPVIAGVMASYLSITRDTPTPEDLYDSLILYSSSDKISIPEQYTEETLNILGYTGCDIEFPDYGGGNNGSGGRNDSTTSSAVTHGSTFYWITLSVIVKLMNRLFL